MFEHFAVDGRDFFRFFRFFTFGYRIAGGFGRLFDFFFGFRDGRRRLLDRVLGGPFGFFGFGERGFGFSQWFACVPGGFERRFSRGGLCSCF